MEAGDKMNLETLFWEMSGYDDFWDYNVGRMPLLGVGRQVLFVPTPCRTAPYSAKFSTAAA